ERTVSKPFSAKTSAARRPNRSDRKRVSKPTMTALRAPGGGCSFQRSAVAWAARATLAKVKSSAMTARNPSVPNLMLIGSENRGTLLRVSGGMSTPREGEDENAGHDQSAGMISSSASEAKGCDGSKLL